MCEPQADDNAEPKSPPTFREELDRKIEATTSNFDAAEVHLSNLIRARAFLTENPLFAEFSDIMSRVR